jgi:hypothetical protein
MNELLLFASCFISVFALGFQSQNVNNGHYWSAFATSFAIGGGHLALYKLMPNAAPSEIAAYLFGGPLGITASMWVHRRLYARRPAPVWPGWRRRI